MPEVAVPGRAALLGAGRVAPCVRGAPEATGNPVRDRAAQVAAPWPFTLGPDPEFELAQWTAGKGPRSAPAPLFYPICETSIGEIFLSLIESLFLCGAEGARFPERAWGERAGVGWEGVHRPGWPDPGRHGRAKDRPGQISLYLSEFGFDFAKLQMSKQAGAAEFCSGLITN